MASSVFASESEITQKSQKIQGVIELMAKTQTGQTLLRRALKQWGLSAEAHLDQKIKFSSVSKTDAVLTRHWDPVTGKEKREREVTVLLRSDQSEGEMALDLVHEMTHALSEPTWDPYDPTLTPTRYIQVTIEGAGGEVDAMETECRFVQELQNEKARHLASVSTGLPRCMRYQDEKGEIMREKIRQDFYRVGKYYPLLKKLLGGDTRKLAYLSGKEPALYSSTGRAPYPVALLKEYEELNQVACENSLKRLQLSSSQAADSRPDRPMVPIERVKQFLSRRCGF